MYNGIERNVNGDNDDNDDNDYDKVEMLTRTKDGWTTTTTKKNREEPTSFKQIIKHMCLSVTVLS